MNVRDFVHFDKEKIEDERKTKFRIKNVACVTHTDLINQTFNTPRYQDKNIYISIRYIPSFRH